MEDKKKALYDALSGEFDLGSFESFSSNIEDDTNRRNLYDAIKDSYNVGDYDSFSAKLTSRPVNPVYTVIEQASGIPYPGKETDKSQYTFTGEQLNLEEESPKGYTQIGRDYKIDPIVAPQFNGEGILGQSTQDYMTDVQKNLDARKKDYNQLRQEQGIRAGRQDVVKDGDRYYTPGGSYDNYLKAGHEVDMAKEYNGVPMREIAEYYSLDENKRADYAKSVGRTPEEIEKAYESKEKGDINNQMSDLYRRIDAGIRGVNQKKSALQSQYEKERGFGGFIKDALMSGSEAELPVLQGQLPGSALEGSREWQNLDKQEKVLWASARQFNTAQKIINAAKSGDFFTGMGDALQDLVLGGSVQDMQDLAAINEVSRKFEKGEKLTAKEEMLLESIAVNVAVASQYKEELSAWYNAGNMVGEMIPYMVEMWMNPLSKLGKKFGEKVLDRAKEKYGKDLAKHLVSTKIKTGAAKLGGAALGGYGMSLTTGLPSVITGVQKRTLGDAVIDKEMSGDIKYAGRRDAEELGTAIYKETTQKMLDNASEMLGAGYLGKPFSWLQKAGKNTRLLGWIDNVANSKFGKNLNDFFEKTNWHGPLDEFMEEIHVGILEPMLVGDTSWGEFFTGKNLATIAIGVSVPGVAMATAATLQGAKDGAFKAGAKEKWKMERGELRGIEAWGPKWEEVKQKLDSNSLDDVDEVLTEIHNDKALTPEQKVSAFEYGIYGLQYRTARGVADAFDSRKDMLSEMLRDAYAQAYSNEPTGEATIQASNDYQEVAKRVMDTFQLSEEQEIDDMLAKNSVETLANGDSQVADMLYDYKMRKAYFEGAQDRFLDTLEEQFTQSDKSIDKRTNRDNPTAVYSTVYDGEQVNITGGNVVLFENGKVDYDNSSETLYVTFPDNTVKPVSAKNFTGVVTVENAEELKAAGRAEIDNRWRSEFDNAERVIDEGKKRKEGKLFNTSDELGEHTVEVLEEGETESRILLDGKEYPISTEELNQWRNEAQAVAPVVNEVAPIPMEKRGNVERAAYHLVPIERTMEDLHDGQLDQNEVQELINARIKEAYNDVQALEKKKPKEPKKPKMEGSKEAYLAAKAQAKEEFDKAQAQWQASMDEAKQRLDYYNELYTREQEITKSEIKEAYDNVQPREVIEMTADEFIANNLPKITPESFKAETGLSNSEQAEMVGYIAGADKGGVTVEQAAESIMENYGDELRSLGYSGDMQDVRDTIINILSQGNPRSYAKQGLAQRKQESIDQQRAEMENVAASLGFKSVEDMSAYEEQVIPGVIQMYTGFDYNEYYNNLAGNYEYDTTRESETVGRGGELLQGEQLIDNAGTPVAEGNEGGAVPSGVQGDGTNAQAPGNEQVTEPVGNSEQLSSSEIPNNQSVAESEDVSPVEESNPLAKHAENIAKRLGVNVTLHTDASTVADRDAMTAIAEGGVIKGWYNPNTGEIALFLPNMESMRDVESTILHEAVSHYGIKHLLGREQFNEFLDGVWDMMPAGTRAHFLQYVGADMKNPSKAKMRQAADEYVAHIAEKMDLSEVEKSIWDRILDFILARLKEVGFANLDRGDIENVIRASYRNLARNGSSSQVTGQGETMASKKVSERRQEKNRINNVLDEVGGIIYGNKEYAKKQRLKREAERKELAKDIYSSVLKGDFNDVILSQIDKFIEDATPANPFGRRISQRLPQRMERALRQGARTNAVDALFSRISESAVPANERFSEAGRREIEERKKELLKGWAIATGNWHTDLKEFTDDTEPIGEGKDSKVYSSKDGRYVIKASKGKPFGKRFRPDIDNIALFNDVFRDTRYEILGYGEIDGEFVRILQQPIVDFAESTPLTSEERREYMQSLGFEPLNDANTAFADGEIVIADLQKGNVVRDAAGNISVIDADAKLHTKDVGGDYTYPPVETDLPEGTDLSGTLFSKVFHGSGAKFDKFDHSFMGTGEGAQAFGWGTYVTEVEGIGKQYAATMRDKAISEKHRENAIINNLARQVLASNNGDKNAALEELRNLLNESWSDKKRVKAQIKIIETGKFLPETKQKAHLYNVEIPDDNGSNYLYWDEVMPKKVETAVKERLLERLSEGQGEAYKSDLKQELDDVFRYSDFNGRSLYQNISAYLGGDKQASLFLNDMGFVGISYPANATTGGGADGARNYVIFNEDDAVIEGRTMFRRANKNQDIFVSNAQRAVEGIKQEKATPEQWIAMLKKNGGLKAGEEAWLGLEEWLNGKQGAVTKQEILDFIGENKIQIEEVNYAGGGEQMENYRGLLEKSKGKAFTDRFLRAFDIEYDEFGIFDEQEAIDLYNEANSTDMQLDKDGYWNDGDDMQTIIDWAESVLKDARGDVREIHRTRIQYTTEGLENKREIALVVPTVESYNIGDYIHFGDAGNGRAVAWVRFGETTDSEGNRVLVIDEIQSKRHQDGREKGYADSRVLKIEERIAEINNTMYGENGVSQEMYEERERLQKELTDIVENSNSELKSVAEMLDEKQKRLKELRYEDLHKGIDERVEIERLRALQDEVKRIDEYDNLENEIKALEQSLDNRQEEIKRLVTEVAEYNYRYSDLFGKTQIKLGKGVPSAPFEKNWHELAMKRMLRLAAEEGFDKVAWTTGEQQAQRYNIGAVVNRIESNDTVDYDSTLGVDLVKQVVLFTRNGNAITLRLTPEGIVRASSQYNGHHISDIVGKELGNRIMTETDLVLKEQDLRIGGEGMKGFYDKMLPSFVSKYTKKWGAKVGEVTMPNLRENNTMHSVDITPEMQESVMEGQTMFSRGDIPEVEQQRAKQQMLELIQPFAKEKREEEKLKDAERVINEFNRTHKGATKKVVVSRGKNSLVQQMRDAGFTDLSIEVAMRHYEGENDVTDGAYYVSSDGIVIYDTENLDITLWHENTHRAIQIMFGGDLSEVQTVYKELPDYIKEDVSSKLNAKKYSEEDIAEEAVCFFVEEAYAGGLLQNGNDNIEGIFGEEESSIKDFAKFAQRLIDYINYGEGYKSEGVSERVSEELRGSAIQERNSRSDKNGEGIDEAAGGEEETRFRISEEVEADGSIDDVKTAPLTLMERITNSLLEVSAKNKENLGLRADALRAYGRDMENLLKLMRAQREYDKSTVDQLVKLAKMYFKNAQLVGEVSTYEMGRILSVINNVVGRKDISANAEKLMDILMDAHNKALGKVLAKAEKVKPKKINASGVEVIGSLDMYGQEMVESYNAGKLISGKQLDDAISDAYNNLADKDREVRKVFNLDEDADVEKFADEYIPTGEDPKDATIEDYKKSRASVQGYELAREYVDNIQSAVKEIADLEKELKDALMAKRKGEMSQEAYNEFRKSTMEAIFESKVGMIDAYHSLISKFSEGVRESGKRAKAFQQAQIDRVKAIQHNANSDMEGHPAKVQGKKPTRHNNAITRALMSPLGTFQTILEKFGEKAVDGKGYLYDRFMTQVTDAGHKEFEGIVAARATIEIKLKELFGKRFDTNKFCSRLREHCATVSYIEAGKEHSFELTRGQALYIYMANKMTDGQMKLRKMGITEEVVASLVKELPEKMVLFADWVQDDLMVTLRGKYNAVHERLFGVSMAAIENYFPLKIRKEGIGEKKELGQDAEAKPSTITGAIIKRTKNSAALDLSADAMQVLFEHIDQMEHWAAFAEFNRDINSLINYRHFQNQVKSMTTLRYGSGDVLWENFQDVVAIATETYKPKRSEFDKAVLNITKGITRSKINFRLYTALKQFLSAPAFWNNAGVKELAFAYANPAGSIKWAMENLPGFKERWMSRSMGNEKLLNEESDWKVFRTKFVENATKWGMTPNAAVDALTVAQGARAVYLTKLRQFKDAGYSEEQAGKKALQRAAESYNESQQSSEGAYLSAMQASGTAAAAIFTTFKNSNFGYTRKTAQAVANISRKMHAGYKKETIEFMKKKMMREGLTEEQAEKFATKIYYKSLYKDVADVALFGAGLGFLWNFGGMAIYLIAGDDDDEKEKILEEIAIRSSLDSLNGIPFGETAINAVMAAREGNMGNIRLPEFIAFGDVKNLAKVWDTDRVKFANDLINMLLAAGVGVEAKPLTDLLVAFGDVEDWSAEEFGLFALRTMSAPSSQLDRLLVDDAMENNAASLEEVAMRYIQYKKGKDTPITGWMYSDEGEQEAVERYGKRFAKYLDERLENVVEDNDTFDVFYNSSEPGVKKSLSSMRQKFLAGENADRYQKFSSRNLILDALEVLKGNLETSVEDATYFEMTNSEDVDATYLMKSEMLKHEDVYKTWNNLKGTEKREYGRLHEKELEYYKDIKKKTDGISRYKSKMKESPENAERNMTKIREKQTQAIELINNYRNE